MSALQQVQTPTPPAPAAPQAPAPAPTPVVGGGTMTQAQKEQLKADIRKTVQDAAANAREAARLAREARADAARAQSTTPVIDVGSGTLQPPINPIMIQNMAENISYAFFITVAVIAIGIPLVRALGRRLGPAPAQVAIPPQMAQQLERIEQAVEAMAIEVERISESQRFLTKLQTGSAEPAALPRSGGSSRG